MTPTIMRTGSRMWKFQESIKKGVEFPGMIKKKIMWNFHWYWFLAFPSCLYHLEFPSGITQFDFVEFEGSSFALHGISKGKVTNLQIPVSFTKSMSSTPSCLDFFWNSTNCASYQIRQLASELACFKLARANHYRLGSYYPVK